MRVVTFEDESVVSDLPSWVDWGDISHFNIRSAELVFCIVVHRGDLPFLYDQIERLSRIFPDFESVQIAVCFHGLFEYESLEVRSFFGNHSVDYGFLGLEMNSYLSDGLISRNPLFKFWNWVIDHSQAEYFYNLAPDDVVTTDWVAAIRNIKTRCWYSNSMPIALDVVTITAQDELKANLSEKDECVFMSGCGVAHGLSIGDSRFSVPGSAILIPTLFRRLFRPVLTPFHDYDQFISLASIYGMISNSGCGLLWNHHPEQTNKVLSDYGLEVPSLWFSFLRSERVRLFIDRHESCCGLGGEVLIQTRKDFEELSYWWLRMAIRSSKASSLAMLRRMVIVRELSGWKILRTFLVNLPWCFLNFFRGKL